MVEWGGTLGCGSSMVRDAVVGERCPDLAQGRPEERPLPDEGIGDLLLSPYRGKRADAWTRKM
jgi:hypothetical protein